MWLDLAEMRLILEALERATSHPRAGDSEDHLAARTKLRDYFREQVERVQKVSEEWERRKAEDVDDAPIDLTDEQVRRLGGTP